MKLASIIPLILMIIALFCSPSMAAEQPPLPMVEDPMTWPATAVKTESALYLTAVFPPSHPVRRFYSHVGYYPVWVGPEGLRPQGEILVALLRNATRSEIFEVDDRGPGADANRIQDAPVDAIRCMAPAPYLELDALLTCSILRYAGYLSRGMLAPETVFGEWRAQRRPIPADLPAGLAQALWDDRLASYLESLQPKTAAFQDLRKALARYRHIERSGGWAPIAAGPTLCKGDSGPRVRALQRRLEMTGDWSSVGQTAAAGYDETVEAAVRRFQMRHGLRQDGRVGKHTLEALNIPVEKRIIQLRLNMERRHWFPDDFGERYLVVNIPAFEMRVVEANECVGRFRVIVGRKNRQTPVMSTRLTHLELNPYWNVPQKIAREDILPKAIDDPAYLSRKGIRVFDSWDDQAAPMDPSAIAWDRLSLGFFPYRLRQDPSPSNALGRIKFIMPNPLSIFIHDTPGKSLFQHQRRSYSSGCVRVEKPLTLARYLLDDQGWNQSRLRAAVGQGRRKTVALDDPIPVHLVYFTAWVAEDGTVNFREDVYGRDDQLMTALIKRDAEPVFPDSMQLTAQYIAPPADFIPTIDTPALTPAGL